MLKAQILGMQIKAVGGCPVEFIALDGTPQSGCVGTVQAQLVCAAGERIKLHAPAVNEVVACYGLLAVLKVNHLHGPV